MPFRINNYEVVNSIKKCVAKVLYKYYDLYVYISYN